MIPTLEQIAAAGVVGAGGGGFPTWKKLSSKADTVILNAAECEPLLHKDKELLRYDTDGVLAGLWTAMQLTGATRGIIGIKAKYIYLVESVPRNIAATPLDDIYPAGDEQVLTYLTTGRVIPPGSLPLAVGVVVLNVETAWNLGKISRTDDPKKQAITHKFLTVAGAVQRPCTLCVPIGTPLSVCVDAAGGVTIPDPHYVVGGAMMGVLEPNTSAPVTKTTSGVIVLPEQSMIVQRKKWDWNRTVRVGKAACDQCSFCTELCPRNLLGHPIEPHRAMRSLGFSNQTLRADTSGTQFCCECNLCSYYSCPEGLDPRNVCRENKHRIVTENRRWENPPFRRNRPDTHFHNRQTPMSLLIRRIGLDKYMNAAPLQINGNIGDMEVHR